MATKNTEASRTRSVTVVHDTPIWLPQTMVWLHTQVDRLPPSIEAHVTCERVENREQFRLPHIHAYGPQPRGIRSFIYRARKALRQSPQTKDLARYIRASRAKVLHSHFAHVGWSNQRAARATGVRHVVSCYGYDVSRLPDVDPKWRERYQSLFESADNILCLGSRMVQNLKSMGCPDEKLRVHHLGVPSDKIKFQPREWRGNEPLRVLIAGTFREKKGIPYALEALGRVHQETPVEITLVGDATQEARSLAEKKRILETLRAHDLDQVTSQLGFVTNHELIQRAYNNHIFLAPSVTASDGDTEGTPVTIMELMATGMPVISTIHADIPELIENGHSGLLVPERDVNGLQAAIESLIDNPNRWQKIAAAARAHIEREYDATNLAEQLARLYLDLTDDRPASSGPHDGAA